MIEPDLDEATIVKVNKDIGNYRLEDRHFLFYYSETVVLMQKDDIFVMRFKSIKNLLVDNSIVLI